MIELNYFDCRGRIQAIRNFLNQRDIPFVDNRVSVNDGFQEWSLKSQDQDFCGKLGLLPTLRLHKDAALISETLVMAFELEPNMSLDERMLISSVYDDVIENVGLLIWVDFAFPGADVKASMQIMFDRMMRLFNHHEHSSLLNDNGERFFSLAQHFMGESLDSMRYVFGAAFEKALELRPRLNDFDKRYSEWLTRVKRPSQFTGRPNEPEAPCFSVHLAG